MKRVAINKIFAKIAVERFTNEVGHHMGKQLFSNNNMSNMQYIQRFIKIVERVNILSFYIDKNIKMLYNKYIINKGEKYGKTKY